MGIRTSKEEEVVAGVALFRCHSCPATITLLIQTHEPRSRLHGPTQASRFNGYLPIGDKSNVF
jgi:hypothetical protein